MNLNNLIGKRVRTVLYETEAHESREGCVSPVLVPDGTEAEVFHVDGERVFASFDHEGKSYHLRLDEGEFELADQTIGRLTISRCEKVQIRKADGAEVRCKRVAAHPSRFCALHTKSERS